MKGGTARERAEERDITDKPENDNLITSKRVEEYRLPAFFLPVLR